MSKTKVILAIILVAFGIISVMDYRIMTGILSIVFGGYVVSDGLLDIYKTRQLKKETKNG